MILRIVLWFIKVKVLICLFCIKVDVLLVKGGCGSLIVVMGKLVCCVIYCYCGWYSVIVLIIFFFLFKNLMVVWVMFLLVLSVERW